MSAAAWFLLALGVAGGAYALYLGVHYHKHRERRRIIRRGASDGGTSESERRAGRDRRQPM